MLAMQHTSTSSSLCGTNCVKVLKTMEGGNPVVMCLSKGKTLKFEIPRNGGVLISECNCHIGMKQLQYIVLRAAWSWYLGPTPVHVLFQCKNRKHLVPQCSQCNATGLTDTTFMKFHQKVLEVCGLQDTEQSGNKRTP